MLASLGIIKGKPFKPDARLRGILDRAVVEAPKRIFATRLSPEAFPSNPYYKDRHYISVWGDVDADWNTPTYQNIDTRAAYFQVAFSSAPAMVNDTVGMGSKYPNSMYDADGDFLRWWQAIQAASSAEHPCCFVLGSHRLQSHRWHDARDLAALPLAQPIRPSSHQRGYFSRSLLWSTKPASAPEENWIQTLPHHGLLIAVRLYGAGAAFYDQTGTPGSYFAAKSL